MAMDIIVSSLAKEVEGTSIAGLTRTYSNRESRMNECGDGVPSTEGRALTEEPICYGGG